MNALYAGLAEIFEVDASQIGPDLDLCAHTWDSLAIVSTIALIDECVGELVDGAALARCRTVADIEALVREAAPA